MSMHNLARAVKGMGQHGEATDVRRDAVLMAEETRP